MKILVTGGAGFIGSHIVDALLAAGHGVAVLDDLSSGSRDNLPPGVPLHVADIVDAAAVGRAVAAEKPDAICHQAAQMSVSRSVREPLFDAQVNCIGLINVLDAAVRQGCGRFVFASSGGVLYGDVTTPAPESTPANPVSPYGITKWVGERYLKFYAEEHGLAVVAIFCKKLLAGEPATINGDGRYVRDYVYGPDVAQANLIAITADLPAIQPKTLTSLNIGTGLGTDVNELEAQLRQALAATLADRGRSAPLPQPLYGPARPGDLRSNLVDASRAAQLLGWKPTVSFADGLASTAAWFTDR
jgi:UDP-glucose 4-epimerase